MNSIQARGFQTDVSAACSQSARRKIRICKTVQSTGHGPCGNRARVFEPEIQTFTVLGPNDVITNVLEPGGSDATRHSDECSCPRIPMRSFHKSDYSSNLIRATETYPGDVYGQMMARSNLAHRFVVEPLAHRQTKQKRINQNLPSPRRSS